MIDVETLAKPEPDYKESGKVDWSAHYRKYERPRQLRRMAFLNNYKVSKGCNRCGFNEHPAALDLHYRDPSTKSFKITQGLNRALDKFVAEMEKCDVLCSNCHRILHLG